MDLPHDLRTALETVLEDAGRDLPAAARELSERYRAQHGRATGPLLRTEGDVAAYLTVRLPATFAATVAVLQELRDRRPGFAPRSLLDAGGGPGTAAWAAVQLWPEIERITVIERDRRMIRAGQDLARHSLSAPLRDATWHVSDLTEDWKAISADLTIASYVIGELERRELPAFIARLWDATGDVCAIVEPGTPRGSALIEEATAQLAALGAQIVAPFPAAWRCVESADDWCHFAARVPRTRLHRRTKGATQSYEDEKFSYVAASHHAGIPIAARVIRHPQVRPGHIRLVLCTAEGVRHVVVTRKNRDAFRLARHVAWGDAITLEDAALLGLTETERPSTMWDN